MPLFLAGMQIGGGLASELLKKKNPKLARNLNTLIGSFTTGAQTVSSLAGAFKSPSTGLTIGKDTKGVGQLANADEYISGLTGSIADKTQQNFAGVKDMMIGSPTNPYNEQANIYNGLYGSLV